MNRWLTDVGILKVCNTKSVPLRACAWIFLVISSCYLSPSLDSPPKARLLAAATRPYSGAALHLRAFSGDVAPSKDDLPDFWMFLHHLAYAPRNFQRTHYVK